MRPPWREGQNVLPREVIGNAEGLLTAKLFQLHQRHQPPLELAMKGAFRSGAGIQPSGRVCSRGFRLALPLGSSLIRIVPVTTSIHHRVYTQNECLLYGKYSNCKPANTRGFKRPKLAGISV
jgi:hypothetical protein